MLITDLVDTMLVSPGCVGLAAVQIGIAKRVFVVDVSSHKKTDTCHGLIVAINPVITVRSRPLRVREGCLSVPDFTGALWRFDEVTLSAKGVDGCVYSFSTNAFESQAIQHEIDHLDGKVFLDRIERVNDVYPRKRYL